MTGPLSWVAIFSSSSCKDYKWSLFKATIRHPHHSVRQTIIKVNIWVILKLLKSKRPRQKKKKLAERFTFRLIGWHVHGSKFMKGALTSGGRVSGDVLSVSYHITKDPQKNHHMGDLVFISDWIWKVHCVSDFIKGRLKSSAVWQLTQ